MKRIVLKNEACIGCGACVGIDAEHFEFSDDGYSVIKSQENLDSPLLADAIDACPVAIISLEESEDSNTTDDSNDYADKNCDCNESSECDCDECHCHDENSCCSHEKEAE